MENTGPCQPINTTSTTKKCGSQHPELVLHWDLVSCVAICVAKLFLKGHRECQSLVYNIWENKNRQQKKHSQAHIYKDQGSVFNLPTEKYLACVHIVSPPCGSSYFKAHVAEWGDPLFAQRPDRDPIVSDRHTVR